MFKYISLFFKVMHEKGNILGILRGARQAMKRDDVAEMKNLSNRTVHTASIHKDTDSVSVAVIVYSLARILEHEKVKKIKGCSEFCQKAAYLLEKAEDALRKDDLKSFRSNLGQIIKSINKLSPNLKKYIQNVFRDSQISKASKIYEHGISMEQTAALLGITMWELADYAGETGVIDAKAGQPSEASDVRARVKLAMEMFS
jgi:hypothetical protein